MLEIAFNELSINEKTNSIAHSQAIFSDFMELADKITALKVAPVRIRTSVDLSVISFSNDVHYTLKDWLKTLDNERRQRYLAYLVQDPIIIDNPYYYYGTSEVYGFGYAFNNSLGSISFFTNSIWNENTYIIESQFLADDETINTETVEVRHVLEIAGKINHENWLDEQFQIKKHQLTKGVEDFEDFWKKSKILFSYLTFCLDVLEQIKSFSSVNDPKFKKALRYLYSLDKHMFEVNRNLKNYDDLPGDISNDGEATLKKYTEERTFIKPDGTSETFSVHCKLGDIRIYFTPYFNSILIGYIGKHLRTIKYS